MAKVSRPSYFILPLPEDPPPLTVEDPEEPEDDDSEDPELVADEPPEEAGEPYPPALRLLFGDQRSPDLSWSSGL